MSERLARRVIKRHSVLEAPLPEQTHLRRSLGTAAVYAIGYGNVGSSIYYALGIVAVYALGATPIALAISGLIFVFTAATYAEGVAMVPTAGGSVAFARRAFNDLYSFLAGWALALNYIATTAISAVSASYYLSYFWPPLKTSPVLGAAGGMVVIGLLMLLNLRGVRETARLNIFFAVIDLATQALLVLLGIGLVMRGGHRLLEYHTMGPRYWPNTSGLLFAVAIAMVAYIGLESAAQMAEETKVPTRTLPKALMLSVLTVLVMFAAIPTVALSAMDPAELVARWAKDPVAGVANGLPDLTANTAFLKGTISLSQVMAPWVAILAFTILLIAANAGILAGSRLTFNLARHRQLVGAFSLLHPRFRTPWFAILVVCGVAVGIVAMGAGAPTLILMLGDLYVFGAMLAFSLAHLSVIVLRVKEPNLYRPFRAWLNVRVKGHSISFTAVLGLLSTVTIWVVLLFSPGRDFARTIGLLWLVLGMAFYVWYRKRNGLSLTSPAVTEEAASTEEITAREAIAQQITHILVPVHTEEYAKEQITIACDLSRAYVADITAIYVVEVPRALPLDAELPDEMAHAQAVLNVARRVAEEQFDRTIQTQVLEARTAGTAIVEAARDLRADLVLLAVGRPRTISERFMGSAVDQVVRNAPCPVWVLTAGGLERLHARQENAQSRRG